MKRLRAIYLLSAMAVLGVAAWIYVPLIILEIHRDQMWSLYWQTHDIKYLIEATKGMPPSFL